MSSTPKEKQSSFSEKTGGSLNTLGDMYTWAPGNIVSWCFIVLLLENNIIPRQVNFVLLPPIKEDIVAGEVAMHDVIGVEVGKGQGYIITEIHLYMVIEWFLTSLQGIVKPSSINSISSTGIIVSGSWYKPKYCTMLGCLTAQRELYSCPTTVIAGSVNWTAAWCMIMAAHGTSVHLALYTAP